MEAQVSPESRVRYTYPPPPAAYPVFPSTNEKHSMGIFTPLESKVLRLQVMPPSVVFKRGPRCPDANPTLRLTKNNASMTSPAGKGLCLAQGAEVAANTLARPSSDWERQNRPPKRRPRRTRLF